MSDLLQALKAIKLQIWDAAKQSLVTVQLAADKAKVQLPVTSVADAQKVLKAMQPKKKREKISLDAAYKQRYIEANRLYAQQSFPNWYKDGHWYAPDIPDTNTANGLQSFIVDFLTWSSDFGNRTGNEGRVIMKDGKPKRIPSSSKNGMQDIDTNLSHPDHVYGIPWKIEVKIGRDTHKDHQKEYGKLVQRTGGVYSVVRNVTDFFSQYDRLKERKSEQIVIFG